MTAQPLHPPGTEIARLALPMRADAMLSLAKALERGYGKGLRVRGGEGCYVLVTPTEQEIEADRQQRAVAKAATRAGGLR